MKKFPSTFQTLSLLLVFASTLVLSSCQQNPSSTAIQTNLLTQSDPLEFYTVFPNQRKRFDTAYEKAPNFYQPEKPVKGAVVTANLKYQEALAGFFKRLEPQNYKQVVVITQTDLQSNQSFAYTTYQSFKTPYGFLRTDQKLVENLQQEKLATSNDKIFNLEIASQLYTPYIHRSFPNATYLPLLVNSQMPPEKMEQLSNWLYQNLDANSLVIFKTSFKTSPDPLIADFQLKFTSNILETFDTTKLAELPTTHQTSLQVFWKYLQKAKAQQGQIHWKNNESANLFELFYEASTTTPRSFHLVTFGDIMLGRQVRSRMNAHGLAYPFSKMDQLYLKTNDILLANLEGPIAKKAIQTSKTIAFRFMPDVAPVLKNHFFDLLSLANNHALDMGAAGYESSWELINEQGMTPFGYPKVVNDNSTGVVMLQDQKIAFLGLDDVDFKIDQNAAVAKIKELTERGYKVIPYIHWGIEYVHTPNQRQKDLSYAFLDAGAIAIIAHHPHVVETFEIYKNKPIFYSLGNAIFDQEFSKDTQEGLSLALIISNDQIEINFLPIKIDQSRMVLMNAEERTNFLKKFVTWGDTYSEAQKIDILNGKLIITK